MLGKHLTIGLLALVILGCGEQATAPVVDQDIEPWIVTDDDPFAFGRAFVASADVRRTTLEQSLVDEENGYSALRLAKYGLEGEGWDELPVWNPPVRRVGTDEVLAPVFVADDFSWSEEAVLKLGRRAFKTFPTDVDSSVSNGLDDPSRFGVWRGDGTTGGFVEITINDVAAHGKTCATCHASTVDDEVIYGRPNAYFDAAGMKQFPLGWPPGSVDVTADGVFNPTAITDLRAIRYQKYLHWAGTLHNSLEALTVRVDTLLITALGGRLRPPREVSFALAYYLWSFGETKRDVPTAGRGAELFATHCSQCHSTDGTTIGVVPIEMVGTDATVGMSPERGTGNYRVPSLYRVADRDQYLHDGSVATLNELLSSDRLTVIPGHEYGLELSPDDFDSLLVFLQHL